MEEDLQKVVEDTEQDYMSDDQEAFDMDNFMTLDEVGEVDDELEGSGGAKDKEGKEGGEDDTGAEKETEAENERDTKTEVNKKKDENRDVVVEEEEGKESKDKDGKTTEDSAAAAGVKKELATKPKLEIKLEPDTPYGEF